jgi:hypothetical protein
MKTRSCGNSSNNDSGLLKFVASKFFGFEAIQAERSIASSWPVLKAIRTRAGSPSLAFSIAWP